MEVEIIEIKKEPEDIINWMEDPANRLWTTGKLNFK